MSHQQTLPPKAARRSPAAVASSHPDRPGFARRNGALSRGAGRILIAWLGLTVTSVGCRNDADEIRQLQRQRYANQQLESTQDHLAEMFGLLERLVELNPQKAAQQILYHLNQWSDSGAVGDAPSEPRVSVSPAFLGTAGTWLPMAEFRKRIDSDGFLRGDVSHLRDAYLFRQLASWVDTPERDDPLLEDWFQTRESGGEGQGDDRLRTAVRLFDWTVRNIALQPREAERPQGVDLPPLPQGLAFEGAGYRQSVYQCLFRGLGDGLQRAAVFIELCRQVGLDAAVLAIPSGSAGDPRPWAVGVLIEGDVYLFEPDLGSFIPGPDQVGIATLGQARRDESVLRRLSVPGFFDYPVSRDSVQQTFALLHLTPELVSRRMADLQQGLTGNRRLVLHQDVDRSAATWEAVPGVAGARWWQVPLAAEAYRAAIETAAARDPMLAFWYYSRWAVLEAELDATETLALGRWRHLQGRFEDREMEREPGARSQYLKQRAPEFEIADLRIDVELQKRYGIRRELGMTPEAYDRQIRQIQSLIRMSKETASFWIALLQYDDQRFDTAENWLRKRVLPGETPNPWEPAARYNLARTAERLGDWERAIELYRTRNDPQEHGNRIRARLVTRHLAGRRDSASEPDAASGPDAAAGVRPADAAGDAPEGPDPGTI